MSTAVTDELGGDILQGVRMTAGEFLDDYERFGVQEYWLIDPQRKNIRAYHREEGKYVEVDCTGESYPSRVLPGFVMDLERIRRHFKDS